MKQRAIAIALALLGLAALLWAGGPVHSNLESLRPLGWTAGGVLLFTAGLIGLASSGNSKTSALLRLDCFLPYLIRRKEGWRASWVVRTLRKLSPSFLWSDHRTKQRGAVRRWLRRLGLSWLSAPLRRVVQAVCLLIFLWLFLYVCWPYTASPRGPALASRGWQLAEIDQQSGVLHFESLKGDQAEAERNGNPPQTPAGSSSLHTDWTPRTSQTVFPANVNWDSDQSLSSFRVQSRSSGSMLLAPSQPLTPEALDLFFTSAGPWVVYDSPPNAWPSHYADDLADKELIQAEIFLAIDPLVSLSTALAARSWVWSLVSAACILLVCVLIPRGFCGYLCPLGTTIDLFDWLIAGRVKRFRVPDNGWWVHIKYYLLTAILISALGGVLISGFFAAIPVITRGLLFLLEPLQSGTLRSWRLVPSFHWGHGLSLLLFFAVLGLGFLRPRFWCKYVCPSGAVFSLGNLFRASERKVESSCIHCNKCVEICPFDAIKPDFTTRTTDCTLCQSCAGVCPTHAIKFVERWNLVELKTENDPPTNDTPIGRRGFLSAAAGAGAAIAGGVGAVAAHQVWGANLDDPNAVRPVRPPGSVPEQEFLQMCIRCGECFKACPNNVLQPEGFQQGLEGLWTPQVVADWAGCESSCNACGQVCPTGAIRALPIEEKKVARMGLAIVNEKTCLPFAGREACDLCVQECNAAGYEAIEYVTVGTQVDEQGEPIEGSGMLAPVVLPDKCVGCGLCQTRCYGINVKEKKLLDASAIIIEAGDGREDRLMSGSYLELRAAEQSSKPTRPGEQLGPDSTPSEDDPSAADDDPFGLAP